MKSVVMIFWIIVMIKAPEFTIKALNILFGLGIELNVYTWLSAFWLQTFVIVAAAVAAARSK